MTEADVQLLSLAETELEALESAGAGGKALGLARLSALGVSVPEAFVLIAAQSGDDLQLDALPDAFIKGQVAVRSSARAEDGAERSYAGQFESVLNVHGEAALRRAVEACLASGRSARVEAYSSELEGEVAQSMALVIQRMVDARAAGVVFTADPSSARRDRVVIDAVSGLGEALVSGEADPHHLLLDDEGGVVISEVPEDRAVLSLEEVEVLFSGARAIAEALGEPLDLEWAIDREGRLWWLQARPITTLPLPLDSLDTDGVDPTHVYTRCNIGEMMPGAVTPLTLSVTVRGIDYGIQAMQVAVGVLRQIEERERFTATFSGHIFLNLSAFGAMVLGVAGSNTERLCRAICGRPLNELQLGKPWSLWRRALNGLRYGIYLMSAPRHRAALARDLANLKVPRLKEPSEMIAWIDAKLPLLFQAYDHHMTSSAVSGALVPALLEILSQGKAPTSAHEATCAALLAAGDASEVESLDLASGVARVAGLLREDPVASAKLESLQAREMAAWLAKDAGKLGQVWRGYLERHGHRSLRELELRQPEWSHDPTPVIESLKVAVRASGSQELRPSEPAPAAPRVAQWVARKARRAAAKREETKSRLVAMTVRFKVAYRHLGELLAERGALADSDQVFFLSHDELARVASGELHGAKIAQGRRDMLEYQRNLSFPEVFVGQGVPEDPLPPAEAPEGGFVGKAVSRGRSEGPARVVTRLEQLSEVQPGEILIATVVDVGWTPCFSIIAGLATEVGSAVSHGCVVAREFGLPAMVGLRGITQVVRLANGWSWMRTWDLRGQGDKGKGSSPRARP